MVDLDDSDGSAVRISLVAGTKQSGEVVFEELLAKPVGGGQFEILHSPGFVLGLAAADVISINENDEPGAFELKRRGGNIAVQIFGPAEISRSIEDRIKLLGGRLDGGHRERLVIYTVPVSAGFGAIEEVLNSLPQGAAGVDWYYGNVYATDGVTPLNWWDPNSL